MLATWGCTTFPKPTLSLDFLGATSLDSGITFSRGSQATLFDSTGTLVYAKQNLFQQSQTIATAPWGSSVGGTGGITVTPTNNEGIAPDGTNTATRVRLGLNGGTTTSDFAWWRQNHTGISGLPYTTSFWAKSYDGTSTYTAQIISVANTVATITITGTWTRFTVTANGTGTSNSPGIRIRGGQTPTNSDSIDILIWGAQLNQNPMEGGVTSSLTTYYPTTTAAYYAPRFDYNPSTLQPRGLLIEEARTNSLTYSDDFANAAWSKTDCSVISNTIVAPDGTLSGDKLIENNAANTGNLNVAPSLLNNTAYSGSVFAKAGEWGWIAIEIRSETTNVLRAWFDISTGAVGTVQSGMTASITSVGNGWYRCVATRTSGPTNSSTRFRLISTNADNTTSTGDGTSGIYVWGAQLEAGAFATSYIATTTTALTRNADVASMTGTNFSSWYNASEGAIFTQASTYSVASNRIVSISDGTGSNRLLVLVGTSDFIVTAGGVAQASINSGSYTANVSTKGCAAYKQDDFAASLSGGSAVTDTSGSVPTGINRMTLGANELGTDLFLNGHIQRLSFYPTRLPNATLQALTA